MRAAASCPPRLRFVRRLGGNDDSGVAGNGLPAPSPAARLATARLLLKGAGQTGRRT